MQPETARESSGRWRDVGAALMPAVLVTVGLTVALTVRPPGRSCGAISRDRSDAMHLQSAAILYLAMHEHETRCPTVAMLVDEGVIDARRDAYQRCRLFCVPDEDGLAVPTALCKR